MADPARDRAIEVVAAALGTAPYDDTGRTAVEALLARPEVLRDLAEIHEGVADYDETLAEKRPVEDLLREYDIPEKDIPELAAAMKEAATPTVLDTSDVPKIWWSPSLAAASRYSNASAGLIWRYVSGQGYVTPPELPSDAVRLVPGAATTPTDDGAVLAP